MFIPAADLKLTSGEGALADYQWTPPGRSPHLHYHFCKTCGVRLFAQGEMVSLGGKYYASHAPTLNDATAEELSAMAVRYVDGLHDKYEREPTDKAVL